MAASQQTGATGAKAARIARSDLDQYVRSLLEAAGLSQDDARFVAQALVNADSRGVASHGVVRLPVYLQRVANGGTSAVARPTVERLVGSTAVVDGANALGLVVGRFGMETALRLAAEHGVGVVTCRRSGHFGAAAEFARMAPPRGCIGIAMTNVNVAMAPWGGITPLLGNNPIAIAAPAAPDAPFVLDMALSTVARGKIRLAAARGEPIPPGWALDAEGRPTVDADVALKGLITPLSGPKGSALAIAVDILCALLSGAALSPGVKPQGALTEPQDVGHFFLALDVAHFVEPDTFAERMSEMLAALRGSTPADGVAAVLTPGDVERLSELAAERDGITLQGSTWSALKACADRLGVAVPPAGTPSE